MIISLLSYFHQTHFTNFVFNFITTELYAFIFEVWPEARYFRSEIYVLDAFMRIAWIATVERSWTWIWLTTLRI